MIPYTAGDVCLPNDMRLPLPTHALVAFHEAALSVLLNPKDSRSVTWMIRPYSTCVALRSATRPLLLVVVAFCVIDPKSTSVYRSRIAG